MKPTFDQVVPAALAFGSLVALAASHWLQMPEQAMTAIVGVMAGSTTLYFVNKAKHQADPSSKAA